MPIHTDDLLEKLDRALARPWMPDAAQCGYCEMPLSVNGPSLDFCGSLCQTIWTRRQADPQMRDGGRGVDHSECWLCTLDYSARAWPFPDASEAHEAMLIHEAHRPRRVSASRNTQREHPRTHDSYIARQHGRNWGAGPLVMTEREVFSGTAEQGMPVESAWTRIGRMLARGLGVDPDR